jgi:CTP:molybdopterin cytidylyltransferase MocA
MIDIRYRNEIEKLDPQVGLRSLTYNFSDDVLEIETDDPGILRDFDTYSDYKKEINKMM